MVSTSFLGWQRSEAGQSVQPGLMRRGLGLGLLLGLFLVLGSTEVASQTGKTKMPKSAPFKLVFATSDTDLEEMTGLINTKLAESWKANKITPAPFCDDHEFIRRVSLDLIGRIAKPDEIKAYLKDPPEKRRSLLIDRLLKHDEYAKHWANLWSHWLLTRTGGFARDPYQSQMVSWLEEKFTRNRPHDEIVSGLLTAKGSNTENGAVNFILAHLGERNPTGQRGEMGDWEMVPITSRITRLFLGTQVQCAQCHNHPFHGSLKQDRFWGINAFLRQVTVKGTLPNMVKGMKKGMVAGPIELHDNTTVNAEGNVFYEQRDGKVRMMRAEFLPVGDKDRGPRMTAGLKGVERREELARLVIANENFPKALVNRMWAQFFGRGFINPIDDFNDNNIPVHPELFQEISSRFKHYNYDVKKLIRWITHSNAYHLSYVANKSNDTVERETQFSRMLMKAMTPEQLLESLLLATKADAAETAEKKREMRNRWLNSLIANFGDDEGNEVNFNGTIVQALLMMNGKDINEAIARKDKGTVALALRSNKNDAAVITELYLASLNRPPRPTELAEIKNRMTLAGAARAKDSRQAMFEDLFWALLNSNEFILNH